MTNNSNSININSNDFPAALKGDQVDAYLNKNSNSKLLVLKLEDLNAELIQQIKEQQCGMVLLNNNFKIVEERKSNQIQITIDGHKQSVTIKNIVRFEACGNYTYIHLKNRTKPILTSRTLKYYVNLLDKQNFIRAHSKYLVNLAYVKSLENNNTIGLTDGTSVLVSRRRLSYIKKALLNR